MVMMGLRLTSGINLGVIENLCGPSNEWIDADGVTQAVSAGWLYRSPDGSKLIATDEGRLRLNHILSTILC